MAKINKEKYYIIQGKDDSRPFIYKGTTPPEFFIYDGKHVCGGTRDNKFVGGFDKGFIKPGECKQLIVYTKDIKQ